MSSAVLQWEPGSSPRTILLIKKHQNDATSKVLDSMATWIKQNYSNVRLLLEPSAAADLPHLPIYHPDESEHLHRVVDFIITVGGDGTILHVSSLFKREVPPVLSFSMGTLGFLMPFRVDEYREAIKRAMQGNFSVLSRMRLACQIRKVNSAPSPTEYHVMNEVAIQGQAARLTTIDCYLNDRFLIRGTGDGMLVATSTGSTAYSFACSGPMIHPAVHTMVVTPISTRSVFFRPIVLPRGLNVTLRLSEQSHEEAGVWFDGRMPEYIKRGDAVEIRASDYPVPTINRDSEMVDWIRAIRTMARFVMGETADKKPPPNL
jgi:NADH kinase